ncbi:hypothetical protein [Streptomyces sp. NPDC093600]|uniref:hypothetical protein n=1 Tax=Streptomyces sp. NPDC093600 TaxID=3366047 RepID=UPI00381D8E4F
MALITSSSKHPDRRLPEEVAAVVEKLERRRLVEVSNADELARRSRPTEKERQQLSSLREQAAKEAGVSEATLQELRSVLQGIDSRLSPDELTRGLQPLPEGPTTISPDVGDARIAVEAGRSIGEFWWNSSNYWWDRQLRSWDGAFEKRYFGGWLVCPDGQLHTHHFGLTALYELHENRLPYAVDGWYKSTPFADMRGTLRAATGNDFFSGDNWSKCWMHLKHLLYIPAFGGVRYLGGGLKHVPVTLANLSQDGETLDVAMNRRFNFPEVWFKSYELLPAYSIWAYVEVSFDLQLEGRGSTLMLDWESGPAGLGIGVPQWTIRTGLYG